MQNVQEVVRTLLKNGAKRVDNAVIKTVSVSHQANYDRVALTLAQPVKAYVEGENGEYEEGETRVIFVSSFSLGAILADNDDTAFAKKKLMQKPQLLELILSYAKIDIIQEHIDANTEYVNPFASNPTPRTIDHDTYINHIVNIELGKRGLKAIDMMFTKLLNAGFDDDDTNEEEL